MAYPAFAQAEAPTEGVGAVVDPGFSKPGWRDAKGWVWSETYYYNIEVWGKVIFLHLCVNLFIFGGWLPSMHHRCLHLGEVRGSASRGQSGGLYPGVGSASRGYAYRRLLHPGGGQIPSGSAYRGVCLHGRQTPPRDTWNTTGYGQQAGSTHPTGMHSCLQLSETERNWTGGSLYFDIFQRSHIKLRANWLSEKGGRVHIIWLNRNEMPHC